MAYAALVSLAQTIDQILNHDQHSISKRPGNQEIISILKHAIFLQAFLEDFPEKAISLEGRITKVANKAEDVLEYLMSEKNRSHCGSIKSIVGPSIIKFKRQLRKEAEKMKSIVGEVIEIKNSVTIKDVRLSDSSAASSISRLAPTGKNDMVGLDDDLTKLKNLLYQGPFEYWVNGKSFVLQILRIVGMGGIGKSILARNIYDDPTTISHFDIRAWVTVSQDYSREEFLSSLLVSMGVPKEKISRQSRGLIEIISSYLKGRRYLIVMDDVWSTMIWDGVRKIFPKAENGSRIVLTTRLFDVAAADGYLHKMRLMDDDQSWNLLQQKVFRYEACPDELEDIGKKIARRCRGLPLSIVSIAELLSTINQTQDSWAAIAENVTSAVARQLEARLSSSYAQLPHHLRLCLLYMGGFPEDYEIRVSKLIRLWVAESFVKPIEAQTFELVAEEYLKDLVNRSLVLVTRWKSNGKIKSCSLHDVVPDFCIKKVQEEKFLLPVMDYLPSTTLRWYFLPQILKNQRRICVTSYDLHLKETISNSPIRTIICIPQRGYRSKGSVQNFRLLRVFHVVHKNDDWVWEPGQVFELIHLRYLAANIPFFPAAISKLQNLQTLIIYRYEVQLPVEIWRLPQLRHLIAFSFQPLPHPEGVAFPLGNLQTLSVATNFICSERILEMIPNLKKLGICNSEAKFDEDYHLDNLEHLHQLEKLKLEMRRDFLLGQYLNPGFRLLGQHLNLGFPHSLNKLTLSGCRLYWTDMAIVGRLPLLEVLKLRDLAFQGVIWHTIEGEFMKLKFLLIDFSDLHCWDTYHTHFPTLERLLLHRCRRLEEIPSCIGEIPTLELIEVDNQNKSLVDSAKLIQEEQEMIGNDGLRVQVKDL